MPPAVTLRPRSVYLVVVIPLLCLSISGGLLGGGGRSISYCSCQSNKTTGNPDRVREGEARQGWPSRYEDLARRGKSRETPTERRDRVKKEEAGNSMKEVKSQGS